MKSLEVRLTDEALLDLLEIGSYIDERTSNTAMARAYTARIRDTCQRIGDAPEGGRLREDAGPGVRGWTFERRALILYRVTGARVNVLRILHGGRQLDALTRSGHQS